MNLNYKNPNFNTDFHISSFLFLVYITTKIEIYFDIKISK